MLNFLIRFGKVKVKSTPGKRYQYSEKNPQKGYPYNPYNYTDTLAQIKSQQEARKE